MKAKINEISLPAEVKHGRLDLTARREKAELNGPMTSKEKTIIEARIKAAIDEAVSPEALLRIYEDSLAERLQELKRNRHELKLAAKRATSQSSLKGGNAATGSSLDPMLTGEQGSPSPTIGRGRADQVNTPAPKGLGSS